MHSGNQHRSKFGPQPIREKVWRAGYNLSEFADLTGLVPRAHVILAMNGVCPPNPELRRVAPTLLGVSLERLFTPESLATAYIPKRKTGQRPSPRPLAVTE